LANNRIGETVIGAVSGTNISFTLSNVDLASNTTYYLYFVRKDAPANYHVVNNDWYNAKTWYGSPLAASSVSVSLQMEIS
jgi:hypothetical protein